MPLFYKNQAKLEAISRKTTTANYRLSDQRVRLFTGRGQDYDELVYLRGQNTDAEVVNRKLSDAWIKFALANSSGTTSNRSDQQQHDFGQNGTYP